MQTKSVFTSKVLWFNLLALVVMVATLFGYNGQIVTDGQPGWISQASNLIQVAGPYIILSVNFILRFFTKAPVAVAKASPAELPKIK